MSAATGSSRARSRRYAAKKGDVLRSRELATAGAVAVGAAWLLLAGPWVLERLAGTLRAGFVWDRAAIVDFSPSRMIASAMMSALPPVFLLGLGIIAISLISQLGFGEGRWIGGNLAPKGSRINPASGLKRMFGPTGWIEMAKGIAKVAPV